MEVMLKKAIKFLNYLSCILVFSLVHAHQISLRGWSLWPATQPTTDFSLTLLLGRSHVFCFYIQSNKAIGYS